MGFFGCDVREVRLHHGFARTNVSNMATDSSYGLLLAEDIVSNIFLFTDAGPALLSQKFIEVLHVLFFPVIGIDTEFCGGFVC